MNVEYVTSNPLLLNLRKNVQLERGNLILQISAKPARNKCNENHCVHVRKAKQTYLRKVFKCITTETCYTNK